MTTTYRNEERVANLHKNGREWTVVGYVSGSLEGNFVKDFQTKREAMQFINRWLAA